MSYFPGWDDEAVGDVSVLNLCSVISDTGTNLYNLPRGEYKILVCIADGSGLLANHIYLCPADPQQALIDITSMIEHDHGYEVGDGGSLYQIKKANNYLRDLWIVPPHLHVADWRTTIGSGGAIADDFDATTKETSIKHSTGVTINTVITSFISSLKLDFTKRSFFQTKVRFGTATSLAFCTGVNADSLSVAASNAQKYALEVCTVTNQNWFARSADGTDKVAEDTGYAIDANNISLKIEHYPDLATPKINFFIGNNTVWEKTTRVPVTGTTNNDNLIKHTFKTNTGGDRTSFNYGCRLVYSISDNWK